MGNLVAIVGRPNVGKSTLFNRLTQSRQAIVNDEAGTTRDRQYGKVYWTGQEFSIVDTGGWVVNSDDVFEEEINKQVAIAIEEADVILFVVDAIHGITDLDDKVAAILRRSKKPTLFVLYLGRQRLGYRRIARRSHRTLSLPKRRRRTRRKYSPYRRRRSSQCREIIDYQRFHRRRPIHCYRYSRNDSRLGKYPLQ